jgi:hypothetical protein
MSVRKLIAVVGVALVAALATTVSASAAESEWEAYLYGAHPYAIGEAYYGLTVFGPQLTVTIDRVDQAVMPDPSPIAQPAPRVAIDLFYVGTMKLTVDGHWSLSMKPGATKVPPVKAGSTILITQGTIVLARGVFH